MKTQQLNGGLIMMAIMAMTMRVAGHAIVVDVDVATPGIQSSIAVAPGTIVPVDIHLVDDGTFTPVTGYGLATNFNDTPGVLGIFTPTVAGPIAAGLTAAIDLVSAAPTAPGTPLVAAGIAPFGAGPGGVFTATNEGTGYFEGFMPPLGPTIPFPLPGGIGTTVVLESTTFIALGAPGTSSDIAPLGILAFGPPLGAAPAIGGPFGAEFYDDSAGAPGGLGGYPAAPIGAFGPTPSLPLGSAGLPPVSPGTIFIVPEPGVPWLALGALALFGMHRRR